MANLESRSLDSLNLSWPHSVNYHVDKASPNGSGLSADREAEAQDASSLTSATTYNGVSRELLRNAQRLSGDEIRLLDLEGGTDGMPLAGALRKVRLSESGVYEPLSYTWKDYDTARPADDKTEDDVHAALFLSSTQNYYLNLTSNCAKALYSVRRPTTDRTIWVDSICVNQDDSEERSHQVDLMKEIYARAFTVLVYLGRESTDHDSSSDIAMSLLGQPDRLKKPGRLDERETTSLKRLFERPYFRRMWIVQEVALAKTVEFHCGSATTYVSKFAGNPLEVILGSGVTPPWLQHSKQIVVRLSRHHAKSQAKQILGLIFDTALCDCKDDRDRIFALFGLLDPDDKERLQADYSLSSAHVYTGIAALLAKNGFLWGVLMLAPRLALNNKRGLPSWVPDWSNVGEIGTQYELEPGLFSRMVTESHDPELDAGLEISKSGVITIRGMLLGSVTISDGSIQGHENRSIWTLTRPNHMQNKSLDSWEWHFEFETRCKQPINAAHVAFMLPDYSTVLILRPHCSLRDQYTVVEIGIPLVRTVLPKDWEDFLEDDWDPNGVFRERFPVKFLKPKHNWKQSQWDTIASSPTAFPRLSGFPAFWSHNPFTTAMSLTHRAIQMIQNIDLGELYLLQSWQLHARIGIQALRDKTRLRQLVDEVNNLRHKDYRKRERATGLDHWWSLESFLSLFIRDPLIKEPMDWPHVQLPGYQPLGETDVLAQLMQWAQVTRQYLNLLRKETPAHLRFLELVDDADLPLEAFRVASFHFQVANVVVRSDADESRGLPGRTSFLLQKISRQLSDEANTEPQNLQRPRFSSERYWDWRRFNSIMEQRFSNLSHIQPDVEKIQANLHGVKPDFGVIAAHQVLAAHGIDIREKDFSQIQIR